MPMTALRFAVAMLSTAAMAAVAVAQTRPDAASGASPAQARALNGIIAVLTRETRLQAQTLTAVARALQTRDPAISGARFIRAVEQKAVEAVSMREQIAVLKTRITALADPAMRDPLLKIADDASVAFEAGRLDDAQVILTRLAEARLAQSETSDQTWLQIVGTQADVAALRSDYEAARSIRLRAVDLIDRRGQLQKWRLLFDLAETLRIKAVITTDPAAYGEALSLLRTRALPLVDRARDTVEWVHTQSAIAGILQEQAERGYAADRVQAFREVRAIFAALFVGDDAFRGTEAWLEAKNGYGMALQNQVGHTADLVPIDTFVAAHGMFDEVLNSPAIERFPVIRIGALNNRGQSLKYVWDWCSDCDVTWLEAALRDFHATERIAVPRYYHGLDLAVLRRVMTLNALDARRKIAYKQPADKAAAAMRALFPDHDAFIAGFDPARTPELWSMAKAMRAILYQEYAEKLAASRERRRYIDLAKRDLEDVRALPDAMTSPLIRDWTNNLLSAAPRDAGTVSADTPLAR